VGEHSELGEKLKIPRIISPPAIDAFQNAWLMCVNATTIPFFSQPGEPKMNDTTTSPAASAIQTQLQRLEWMIPDAKRRVAKAAEQMLWRAQRAVEDASAMLSDQPCSLSWTEFAEGDLREAKEAKAELNKLYEQQKLLQYLLSRD
jgi:hypothetical protein